MPHKILFLFAVRHEMDDDGGQEGSTDSWERLPDELWIHIFRQVRHVWSRLCAGSASRRLYGLADDDALWHEALDRDCDEAVAKSAAHMVETCNVSWRTAYATFRLAYTMIAHIIDCNMRGTNMRSNELPVPKAGVLGSYCDPSQGAGAAGRFGDDGRLDGFGITFYWKGNEIVGTLCGVFSQGRLHGPGEWRRQQQQSPFSHSGLAHVDAKSRFPCICCKCTLVLDAGIEARVYALFHVRLPGVIDHSTLVYYKGGWFNGRPHGFGRGVYGSVHFAGEWRAGRPCGLGFLAAPPPHNALAGSVHAIPIHTSLSSDCRHPARLAERQQMSAPLKANDADARDDKTSMAEIKHRRHNRLLCVCPSDGTMDSQKSGATLRREKRLFYGHTSADLERDEDGITVYADGAVLVTHLHRFGPCVHESEAFSDLVLRGTIWTPSEGPKRGAWTMAGKGIVFDSNDKDETAPDRGTHVHDYWRLCDSPHRDRWGRTWTGCTTLCTSTSFDLGSMRQCQSGVRTPVGLQRIVYPNGNVLCVKWRGSTRRIFRSFTVSRDCPDTRFAGQTFQGGDWYIYAAFGDSRGNVTEARARGCEGRDRSRSAEWVFVPRHLEPDRHRLFAAYVQSPHRPWTSRAMALFAKHLERIGSDHSIFSCIAVEPNDALSVPMP